MIKVKEGPSNWGSIRTFMKVGSCSETLCKVVDQAFEQPLETEEHATMPLAGGIMQNGYQCGMVWGASLAAGAQAYRVHGTGPKAETAAVKAAQDIIESFRTRYHTTDCFEITETDWRKPRNMWKFILRGGPVGCFKMAGKYSPVAYQTIKDSLATEPETVPESPVSCATELAKKMNASDLQQTMAAGLAGGIGLCGGGCGALGAAIWLRATKSSDENGKVDYNDPKLLELIEGFLKQTEHEFECATIIGRKFTGVDDHAAFVRQGGCSELIEMLAQE